MFDDELRQSFAERPSTAKTFVRNSEPFETCACPIGVLLLIAEENEIYGMISMCPHLIELSWMLSALRQRQPPLD